MASCYCDPYIPPPHATNLGAHLGEHPVPDVEGTVGGDGAAVAPHSRVKDAAAGLRVLEGHVPRLGIDGSLLGGSFLLGLLFLLQLGSCPGGHVETATSTGVKDVEENAWRERECVCVCR